MSENRMVSHDGKVVRIENNHVFVKIISESACAKCHAKGLCTAADMKEKIIEAISHQSLQVGDPVEVKMTEKMGKMAIIYGFFLPFILMISVLFILNTVIKNQLLAAIFSLASLLPYYTGLYMFRNKIEADFVFVAEKKQLS